MSSKNSAGSKAASQIAEESMYSCYVAREKYLNFATSGRERNVKILRNFHSQVLNYYFTLRRLRDRNEVKEEWENARVLRPDRAIPAISGAQASDEPVPAAGKAKDGWVYGLENLAEWSDKKITGHREAPGDTESTDRITAPAILAPEDLLRVSGLLDDIAESLNLSASPQSHNRPKGHISSGDIE